MTEHIHTSKIILSKMVERKRMYLERKVILIIGFFRLYAKHFTYVSELEIVYLNTEIVKLEEMATSSFRV